MTSAPKSSEPCLPTNCSESIVKRLDYRRRTSSQAARNVELARCAADVVHWCNHWAFTYDPREPVSTLPFDLFPRQAEFLHWLAEREQRQQDGLVEKSR